MEETQIRGVRVRFRNPLTSDALLSLNRTLVVVPAAHLRLLRQIDVLPPANFGVRNDDGEIDTTYAGGGSGIGWPRVSELCFVITERPNNVPLNLTLLHEIGHVMETHFSCLRFLPPDHRRVLDSVPIPTDAHTHGPTEHYAIAYQKVLCGTATAPVARAVYASRAFEGISAPSSSGTSTGDRHNPTAYA